MNKIISDESLRRALAHLAPSQATRCAEAERETRAAQLSKSTAWMDAALAESTREALRAPWVLDVDSTVKLLYGHQAGAEVGYNLRKPGRPSHTLHTDWIGSLRLVLDVEMHSGKRNEVDQRCVRELFSRLKESGLGDDLSRMAPFFCCFEKLIQLNLRGAFTQVQENQNQR